MDRKKKVNWYKCPRCGYKWRKRVEHPRKCPVCNITLPYWKKWAKQAIRKRGM